MPQIVPLADFQATLRAQGMSTPDHCAFVCPLCGTVQSASDLIEAGAGKTFSEVENLIGFSCIGRWQGAPAPRKQPDGNPCNWTLGGFLQLHTYAVEKPDGEVIPFFTPADPEVAHAHFAKRKAIA